MRVLTLRPPRSHRARHDRAYRDPMPVEGDTGPDDVDVVTWHYGLIAKWWALFNLDGPEIEFFRPFVEAGQPALDAACGTGRLLVPWVAAGLDVDGVDASADMIAGCREAAQRVGRNPTLYVQPLHRLELPRRYGAIIVCGGFGLGATREHDWRDSTACTRTSTRRGPGAGLRGRRVRRRTVADVAAEGRRRVAAGAGGSAPRTRRREYALRHRIVAVDVAARRLSRELQAWQWSRRGARRPREPPTHHQRLFLDGDRRGTRRRRLREHPGGRRVPRWPTDR